MMTMSKNQAAKLVADTLTWAARSAPLAAIREISHDGNTIRFRDNFADEGKGYFTLTVESGQ